MIEASAQEKNVLERKRITSDVENSPLAESDFPLFLLSAVWERSKERV